MRLEIYRLFNRPVHSYMAVFQVIGEEYESNIFVVCDDPAEGSSSSSVSTSSSSVPNVESSSSSIGSSSSSGGYPFTIYPRRVLVSIASLTDLEQIPLIPPLPGKLYRTYTVGFMCRSRTHLEALITCVKNDVHTLYRLLGYSIPVFEEVELTVPSSVAHFEMRYTE